jgi:Gly-Xaa carboxypeptidase
MEKALATSSLPLRSKISYRRIIFIFILLAFAYLANIQPSFHIKWAQPTLNYTNHCIQPSPLFPQENPRLDASFDFISSDSFKNATIARLSGAVKIKTETFDDLGEVGFDPRWEVFYNFHAYLKNTFPLAHEKLLVEKLNTYGLLYTWQGK